MKVHLQSIGCRLNQAEMEALGRKLLAAGHEIVDEPGQADKLVINTCAVTAAAARDARKLARRGHRQAQGAEILLTGCYATLEPEALEGLPGVSRVLDNERKDDLPALLGLSQSSSASAPVIPLESLATSAEPSFDLEPILRAAERPAFFHTRAFVKVQDGCDQRCSFCVTTLARGRSRSRRLAEIVTEVRQLHAAGYQEAVLTGVHLGSYGRDLDAEGDDGRFAASSSARLKERPSLRSLIAAILAQTEIPRLRVSSLEPWDIDSGFFQLWRDPRLMPHIHLPLQSGSQSVLRRMARNTTPERFAAIVHRARAVRQDMSISTDIIAGFPGETEAEHRETLDFARRIGFSRLHVFPYSPRPGTKAAEMGRQVPETIKKTRVRELLALDRGLRLAYHRRFEGTDVTVLLENAALSANSTSGRQAFCGHTDHFVRLSLEGPAGLGGQVLSVRARSAHSQGLEAEPLV